MNNLATKYAQRAIFDLIERQPDVTLLTVDDGAPDGETWTTPAGRDGARKVAHHIYEIDGPVYVTVGAITLAFLAQEPDPDAERAEEILFDWSYPRDPAHPLHNWEAPTCA